LKTPPRASSRSADRATRSLPLARFVHGDAKNRRFCEEKRLNTKLES